MIITSPPYLNAIDYLRGHKLSLVWMGQSIARVRNIRSTNIGTEKSLSDNGANAHLEGIVDAVFNYGVLVLALLLCWFVLY